MTPGLIGEKGMAAGPITELGHGARANSRGGDGLKASQRAKIWPQGQSDQVRVAHSVYYYYCTNAPATGPQRGCFSLKIDLHNFPRRHRVSKDGPIIYQYEMVFIASQHHPSNSIFILDTGLHRDGCFSLNTAGLDSPRQDRTQCSNPISMKGITLLLLLYPHISKRTLPFTSFCLIWMYNVSTVLLYDAAKNWTENHIGAMEHQWKLISQINFILSVAITVVHNYMKYLVYPHNKNSKVLWTIIHLFYYRYVHTVNYTSNYVSHYQTQKVTCLDFLLSKLFNRMQQWHWQCLPVGRPVVRSDLSIFWQRCHHFWAVGNGAY